MRELIRRAGGSELALAAHFRKNASARANAKTDSYALHGWCLQVLATANERSQRRPYETGTADAAFLRDVAKLSRWDNGPMRAQEYLAAHGIQLVVVPHLPRTHLDGAALKLADGTPVVGLTLRYDRVDNFWFCLLHELAHVGLHLDRGGEDASFFDDFSLRGLEGDDPREVEADEAAEEALVPRAVWETSEARANPTASAVIGLAAELGIHPAIVAGRIRYERADYRLLSQFVGTGTVRKLFGLE